MQACGALMWYTRVYVYSPLCPAPDMEHQSTKAPLRMVVATHTARVGEVMPLLLASNIHTGRCPSPPWLYK